MDKSYLGGLLLTALSFVMLFIFCYNQNNAAYKEVYYLKYTIYYPGNTCTYEVDSCNHIYSDSYKGTNYIMYYSIPNKEHYNVRTTAPIVINEVTKR